MGIQTALDAVLDANHLIDAIRLADDLAFEASRDGGARTVRVLSSVLSGEDSVAAIAATHALGQVGGAADAVLSDLLSADRAFLAEHAAWVLLGRPPIPGAVGRLVAMVARGGFSGMAAQRTLELWSGSAPDMVAVAVEGALLGGWDGSARRRLAETLGLVASPAATRALLALVRDPGEDLDVRVAALAGLGQRRGDAEIAALVSRLGEDDGYLGDVARVALVDLMAGPDDLAGRGDGRPAREGLTVAQLFLHADIDPDLSAVGSGDNGGIATLLVRLGDALVAGRDIASPDMTGAVGHGVRRVLTMSRGSAAGAADSIREIGERTGGHVYGRVPLLSDPVPAGDAWPLRVAARYGIRRVLRAAGGADVLHLRMADVGSLAAADVANELDIPVVFTVAPDPHAVIHSMDLAGQLRRETFGDADLAEHYWFRCRLVQRLAGNAAHTVLFPRPRLQRDMRQLVGIDITAHPERHTVVPEGIDLDVIDEALAEATAHAAGAPATPALADLTAVLADLPPDRRGLPLLISVGRLHRVKGMAAIVSAWRNGPLAGRANLLVVGGDLTDPSPDERDQLRLIDAVVAPEQRAAAGLLLPGHRSNGAVARWLAAVRTGVPGLAAPGGIYVCGSLKEEFGIAILEAMAAGLIVVAPEGGGPATYVSDGLTGWLTRTWDPDRLSAAMVGAFETSRAETGDERARRSRATVAARFTIQAMARALEGVYAGVHEDDRRSRDRPALVRSA